MAYPRQTDVMLPLLAATASLGGAIRFSQMGDQLERILADYFDLSEEDRTFSHPAYKKFKGQRKWRMWIEWARKKLGEQGLYDLSTRDVWRVSPRGTRLLLRALRANNR